MTACCKGLDVLLDRSEPTTIVWPDYFVGAATPVKKYVVMHIENPKGLVAKEKGEGLAFATNLLVPEFIENTIYNTVAEEFRKQFREKGSEVSVYVTETPPKDGVKLRSDLGGGIFLGVLLSGLTYAALKMVRVLA